MSEYWISQKKHWCQYCKIYITDNKPSRTMHENGKKHKDNVEKFLRNVYHTESENRKEQEKTKKELDRIERAALKQYKKDVILLAPGSSISHLKPPPLPPTTTSNNYSNKYTESSSTTKSYNNNNNNSSSNSKYGYEDDTTYTQPVKNTEESMIGEWRPVTPPLPSIVTSSDNTESSSKSKNNNDNDNNDNNNENNKQPVKEENYYNQYIEAEDDEENPDDLINFKIVEKKFPLDNQLFEDEEDDNNDDNDDNNSNKNKEEKKGEKISFKKRKLGGSGKQRNVRKKT